MKEFIRLRFDPAEGFRSLDAFKSLLDEKEELEENADIKPFFEEHPHLALLLGSAVGPDRTAANSYAFQYQLFGDFSCDLAVGDSRSHRFVFVEWEDATESSLFRIQGRKSTPEWSPRFEKAFSQLVDWFWKLDDMHRTDEFDQRFGSRHAEWGGVLVVGRDAQLQHPREQNRWRWRSMNVRLGMRRVVLVTYDQLHAALREQLEHFCTDA